MNWTPEEDEEMRRLYPSYKTADLAFLLGRSVPSVENRRHKLGLSKTPEFLAEHGGRIKKGNVPRNKGITGVHPAGCEKGWFRKGNQPHTTLPLGTERISKDGILMRKAFERSGNGSARWRSVHELVWVAANGPLPPGHIVVFKPGKRTVVAAEITLDRVECISLAENMARNTVHNHGPEVAQLVQLRGALNRQINAAERGEAA